MADETSTDLPETPEDSTPVEAETKPTKKHTKASVPEVTTLVREVAPGIFRHDR